MYIRFVIAERDSVSKLPTGIFQALFQLRDNGGLTPYEMEWLEDVMGWFRWNLLRPRRFAWSRRPGAPEAAICWMKLSSVEHVSRLHSLAAILEYKGIPVQILRTHKPGYIVYEDDHQVTAMPFARETFPNRHIHRHRYSSRTGSS